MNFIKKITPQNLVEDVDVDSEINVYFFPDMNMKLMQADKIILFNITEERSESIEIVYRNRNLKIKPRKLLKPNMHYQVQIIGGEDGVRDITGRIMPQGYVSEFYTKAVDLIDPPILTSPVSLTEIKDDVLFKWKPAENAAYYELEISRSNTFHNLVWPNESMPIYETSLQPYINYEYGAYYARIRSVTGDGRKSEYSDVIRYHYSGSKQTNRSEMIKDLETIEDGISFKAQTSVIDNDSILESIQKNLLEDSNEEQSSFSLSNSSPKHKAVNLNSENTSIELEFNKEIDENSVTSDSVYLIKIRQ